MRKPRSLGTTVILDLGIRNLRFKVLPVSLTLCVAFELLSLSRLQWSYNGMIHPPDRNIWDPESPPRREVPKRVPKLTLESSGGESEKSW